MPADDEEASGPPPHPFDRVWFHPSELGAAGVLAPQPAPSRVWTVAALALLVGIGGTLGLVTLVGGFSDRVPRTSAVSRLVDAPFVDPNAVATLVSSTGRNIVSISITGAEGGEPTWAGSGVVVRGGRVLTAAHLLTEGATISVITSGGQIGTAEVMGIDPETDLALLKVEDVNLAPARLGTGDGLRIGQSVAALAAGPAPQRWVSAGVVSGTDRLAPLAGGVQGSALIETDTRFVPTSAGGALLDAQGAVIGILTGPGSYAVPIDVARDVLAQLEVSGKAAHGWAGILGGDALDRPGGGVRIGALVEGSPAEAAELRVGDVVLAVGDVGIDNMGELVAAFRRLKPGDPVEVTVIRDDGRERITLNLAASVATPSDWQVVA